MIQTKYTDHDGKKLLTASENAKALKQIDSLVFSLIKKNSKEPLLFHTNNFRINNINHSDNKIKNLLQKIREYELPSNDEILLDISKIRINFDDFNNDKEGVPFCLSRGEFVNLRYKNSILTTLYQLKIASDCDDYFLDGTFKIIPKR